LVIVAFPFIIWGEDSLHGLGYFGIHYLLSSGRISHAIEAISQENDHKKVVIMETMRKIVYVDWLDKQLGIFVSL
jgi:hypothetical protein